MKNKFSRTSDPENSELTWNFQAIMHNQVCLFKQKRRGRVQNGPQQNKTPLLHLFM
jgi:hypothetical protein